jgi:hypothetical protein
MIRLQGFAENGDANVYTAGLASTTLVQASFPGATVTVYFGGTTNLATLYSDNQATPTPLANPFTAAANGYWFFYAPDGRYDVKFSATGVPAWTLGDVPLSDIGGVIGGIGGHPLTGAMDGVNTVFTSPYVMTGFLLFRNGICQMPNTDYTFTAAGGVTTITFITVFPPQPGDVLYLWGM